MIRFEGNPLGHVDSHKIYGRPYTCSRAFDTILT